MKDQTAESQRKREQSFFVKGSSFVSFFMIDSGLARLPPGNYANQARIS